MQPQPGDVVRLVADWTALEQGGGRFLLSDLFLSPSHGWCVNMRRIEHMPGSTYPRGNLGEYRSVPVAFVRVLAPETETWRFAHAADEPDDGSPTTSGGDD